MKRTSRFISTLALMLMALGAAPSGEAANLKARSATIDPATGYPTWYQDNNNLALTNCLDNSAFCLPTGTVLPLPANKANINAQNFPPESFYFLASGPVGASSPLGTISNVLYIAALEAGFAANVVDGGQAVFTRIRIRADVTLPGTYTVTHPYGTDTFVVDAASVGIRAINFSEDIPGLVANQFDASLTSRMGPFLTRADGTFITDPTTGNRYIGQPGALVAVTGSPLGNNFVTITAPNGDNLTFNTFDLQGKVIGLDVAPKTTLDLGPVNIAVANAPGTLLIPQTVTVTNTTGNPITFAADLNATGIKGGADAADFIITSPSAVVVAGINGCAGATVAAVDPAIANSGKCSFDIAFKPAAVAKTARVATLLLAPTAAIAANNPPPVTLNLSGTAQVLVTAAAVGDGTITPATQAVGAGGAATFTVKPLTKKFKVKDVAEGVTLFAPSPTDATAFTIPNVGAVDHAVNATFMPSGDLDASGTLDINDAVKALKIVAGVQAADADDPDNTAVKVAPLVGGVPAPDAARVQTNIGDVLVILRRVIGLETW